MLSKNLFLTVTWYTTIVEVVEWSNTTKRCCLYLFEVWDFLHASRLAHWLPRPLASGNKSRSKRQNKDANLKENLEIYLKVTKAWMACLVWVSNEILIPNTGLTTYPLIKRKKKINKYPNPNRYSFNNKIEIAWTSWNGDVILLPRTKPPTKKKYKRHIGKVQI